MQPGHLYNKRPVAFRPYFTIGLANQIKLEGENYNNLHKFTIVLKYYVKLSYQLICDN
jgi:hypothetical protein